MELEIRMVRNCWPDEFTIQLLGKATFQTAPQFALWTFNEVGFEAITSLYQILTIDLTEVTDFDGAALTVLNRLHYASQRHGHDGVKLVVNASLMTILETSGLNKVFGIQVLESVKEIQVVVKKEMSLTAPF